MGGDVPPDGASYGIGGDSSGGLNSSNSRAGTSTHGKDEGDSMVVSCADGYLHGLRGWVVDGVWAKAGLEPLQVLVGRLYGERVWLERHWNRRVSCVDGWVFVLRSTVN